MKKILLLVIIATAGVLTFANTGGGGKKNKSNTTPPKGYIYLNFKDSTAVRRVSDSLLTIPAGFKLVEKPR